MSLRGKKSEELTRYILELFVEHRELNTTDIWYKCSAKFPITRKAIRTRLQHLRNTKIVEYNQPSYGSALPMKLTLHGECFLVLLRRKQDDPRTLPQKALSNYKRWGQRRKNGACSQIA